MIKDLDTGAVYDIRNSEDYKLIEDNISSLNKLREQKLNFMMQNLKIQDKINTKFFKACERGDLDKIINILDRKTSRDRKPNINEKYLHDYTVLHIAITNGHLSIVTTLLQRGASIEVETSMKRRPIHMATLHGNFEIVDYLVSCGAEVNCLDIDNNTPLHYASRLGNEEIVEFLLHKRSDFRIRNIFGETPLDLVGNIHIYKVNKILTAKKIFSAFMGEETFKKNKSEYSRLMMNNRIFHNNRCDNVRALLYKDRVFAEKKSEDFLKHLRISHIIHDMDFPTDAEVNLDSFKILELLGKGSFGEVYLVEHLTSKRKYAMKVLNKSKILSQNIIRYVVTERNVLSDIKHPFIVHLYYAFQTDEFLYLILEYCEGKDLCFHLRKEKVFDEETVKIILAQLLLALEELHKNNIIYRDLKPENIVLDTDGYIKLTDFGLSKQGINDNTSAKSFCGSLAYLAPEVLNRQGHGKSVDWYLFGVLMYEMLMGIPPFYTNLSKEALFYNIKNAKLTFPKKLCSNTKNLIMKLMNRNPNKRLGSGILDANEIKSHAFFSGINFTQILLKQFIPPQFILNHFQPKSVEKKEKFPFHLLNEFVCNKELLEDMKNNKKSANTSIEGWTFIGNNKYTIK